MTKPAARDLPADYSLVRCTSHRARQGAANAVGTGLKAFFSWETRCTGGFVAVPDASLPAVLAVKGCSLVGARFTYQPCIEWA